MGRPRPPHGPLLGRRALEFPVRSALDVGSVPTALAGLSVLDLATFVAAPFCCTLLGEFGAEVIKVEQPGRGDDLRRLGTAAREGLSYWWLVESRNKKSITCNLREPDGQALVKRLAGGVDVLAENFRPGTMERWGLGWDELRGGEPAARDGAHLGLRPDGPLSRAAGVRPHRGGDGRPLLPVRLSRSAAGDTGHADDSRLPGRRARRLRCPGGRAAPPRVGGRGRWWTSGSTSRCCGCSTS